MYISKLEMINFRNFRNSELNFGKGVNTIIGENSSGKSNILYALRLLLDDDLPFNATKLLETDFNSSLKGWKGHWIIIKLTFSDLGNEQNDSLITHITQNVDNNTGSFALYFKPKNLVRKKLYEFSQQIKDKKERRECCTELEKEIDSFLNSLTIDDYESVYTNRVNANFTDYEQYKSIVGDFDKKLFPDPDEDNNEKIGNIIPHITLIKKEVSCTYVKALRNVVSELKQKKKSPLLQLLRGSTNNIEVKDTQSIKNKIEDVNTSISELKEINDLTHKLKTSLTRTLGLTYSPKVNIKSELPEEIETLFQSLTLWVGDDYSSKQGKLDDLSLGGANLIYITLKLLEYEFYQDSEEKAAHFLLIEEPEAHIHTHVQKTLFDKYHFDNTQVIITTHSTHISSASKITSMNILTKRNGYTEVCQPNKGLDDNVIKRIERYLDATRSTLLFAKGVILVEGDAEMIIIPELFKKVFGVNLDELGISIVNMSSAVFDHIAELFHDNRLKRKCAIITDLDKSLVDLPEEQEDENQEVKKARQAQISGEQRKVKLENKYGTNSWVKIFYANNTFETDFVISGNEREIINTLPYIYNDPKYITSSTYKLNSSNSYIKAKETLRLAEKEGKGWFALLLAEKINVYTKIPDYILSAIAFASEHITSEHLLMMAEYRFKNLYGGGKENNFINLDEILQSLNEKEKDILSSFIEKVGDIK